MPTLRTQAHTWKPMKAIRWGGYLSAHKVLDILKIYLHIHLYQMKEMQFFYFTLIVSPMGKTPTSGVKSLPLDDLHMVNFS